MVTPVYAGFLVEESEFAAAERFWNELFKEVVGAAEIAEWTPWRPRAYANGSPFERDGNPIFDARNVHLGRALQVIQWACESEDVEISAWISELEIGDGEHLAPVSELTINLSLSVESAAIAKLLIGWWVDENVFADELRQRIATLPDSA